MDLGRQTAVFTTLPHLFFHSVCFGSNLFARHWAGDCISSSSAHWPSHSASEKTANLIYVLYKRYKAENSDKACGNLRGQAQLLFLFEKGKITNNFGNGINVSFPALCIHLSKRKICIIFISVP